MHLKKKCKEEIKEKIRAQQKREKERKKERKKGKKRKTEKKRRKKKERKKAKKNKRKIERKGSFSLEGKRRKKGNDILFFPKSVNKLRAKSESEQKRERQISSPTDTSQARTYIACAWHARTSHAYGIACCD